MCIDLIFFYEELTKCFWDCFSLFLLVRSVVHVNDVLSLNSTVNKMCKSNSNASRFSVGRRGKRIAVISWSIRLIVVCCAVVDLLLRCGLSGRACRPCVHISCDSLASFSPVHLLHLIRSRNVSLEFSWTVAA